MRSALVGKQYNSTVCLLMANNRSLTGVVHGYVEMRGRRSDKKRNEYDVCYGRKITLRISRYQSSQNDITYERVNNYECSVVCRR